MRATVSRMLFIDALKALASQLIVLHHLAFYGPMSDAAHELAPALISWLSQDARIAVQIFLVIGGFLAARMLAPGGKLIAHNPLGLLKNRYLKLALPYCVALVLSIVGAAMAMALMEHDSIPSAPTVWQFIAHAFLLQNILGYDALSAGVWYIAIDFQLFALLLGALWLARVVGAGINGTRILSLLFVTALALASLFYFNRDPSWDNWALYFFGSYALGILTYWASDRRLSPDWLMLIAGVVIVALLFDFRSRIAIALLVALMLGIAHRWEFLTSRPKAQFIAYLGQISYSVFLVSFPVCLVINALFAHFALYAPAVNAFGMVVAWAVSIAAGALFYRFVESRTYHWQGWMQASALVLLLRWLERAAFLLRLRVRTRTPR